MSSSNKSSLICDIGSESTALSNDEIQRQIDSFLDGMGEREDVLILPPDYTRFHSQAGMITRMVCEHYNFIKSSSGEPAEKKTKSTNEPGITILPALGTHAPMTKTQISSMFGEKLGAKEPSPFLVHDWRNDVVTIGHVPNKMVRSSQGLFIYFVHDFALLLTPSIFHFMRSRCKMQLMGWWTNPGQHN